MPRQGNTVESCIVTQWHKQKGDKVKEGELLFTYETDKATFDEESPAEGTLLEIYFEEGDDVPVLMNMCVIGEEGEDTSEFVPDESENELKGTTERPAEKKDEPEEKSVPESEEVAAKQASPAEDGIFKISPRAENRAKKTGVDAKAAKGTGPGGRVIERDILNLEKTGPAVTKAAAASYVSGMSYAGSGIGGRITTGDIEKGELPSDFVEYEDEKLTNIRKVIARTMHGSLSDMAQLTMNMSFDASALMNLRKSIKGASENSDIPNITLNDMIVYATAKTLVNHRDLNAHFDGGTLRRFNTVHMGVAVDTDRGLMVPTIYYSDMMTIGQISAKTKELAAQSKTGNINPDILKGGTFTITTLGSLGVESFTPVINPPQTAILGVCGITTGVSEEKGGMATYPSMGLSLTIDHRVVDGAPAARFLRDLCSNLENFELLLLK
jgi:pyruvate dehydrogenase E2 component (dihydrolipoamide acetyltransferase)